MVFVLSDVRLDVATAHNLSAVTRAEIIQLCEVAYDEGFSRLFDDLPGSIHVLARVGDGPLVSHAEIVERQLQPAGLPPLKTAYIEAVATAPPLQRRGLATQVMERLMALVAADPSWQLAALSPAAPGFYERLGWEAWRGPLAIRRGNSLEPTPPDELVMIRRLATTPPGIVTTALLTAEWRPGEPW